MDHLVYTGWPDIIASIVLGGLDILAIPDLSEDGEKYTGRMLLHTCAYPEWDKQCKKNIEAMDLTVESFPGYAIHGRATVKSITKYLPMLFAAEHERHGNGTEMKSWLKDVGILDSPDVWRIELSSPEALSAPILDIYGDPVGGDDGIYKHGDLWRPSSPLIMEAVKMALSKDREIVATSS